MRLGAVLACCVWAVLLAAPARAAPGVLGRCADVTFVGARASGERRSAHHGLGAAIEHLEALLAERLAPTRMTVRTIADPYPAEPTRDLYLPWRGRVPRWFRGLAAGAADAAGIANGIVGACPATMLVLAGYSQGAMAIHEALTRLAPAVLARTAAVVLVGDGDRVRRTRATQVGTAAPRARGIRAALLPWTRRDVALPGRTVDLCAAGDLVCDFASERLAWPPALRRAIAAHRSYADPRRDGTFVFGPGLARAAARAARLVLAGPVPPRGPTAVLTGVGASFAGWVAATGEPLLARPGLPAGLHRDRCLLLLLPAAPPDAAAVARYLRAGGTVVGVGERGDDARFTRADHALTRLAGQLGVRMAVTADARDPGTTTTAALAPELAAGGVGRLGYDWTSGLTVAAPARVLAQTADGGVPILAVQRVGGGRFVLAGDSDLFTGGRGDAFGAADNGALARALCP